MPSTPACRSTSVFVGGGTPTLVPADGLAAVLGAIPLAPGAEVTVECNPDDVTAEMLRTYAAAGVNRVSLGVQSMVPHVLAVARRGRTSRPTSRARSPRSAPPASRRSTSTSSTAPPARRSTSGAATRRSACSRSTPPHVSAYALTVEAGTPLADDPTRHPDDDDQADKYELADDLLAAAGLANYEVSNWALPGHECRHNLLYWQQGDYRGFGSRGPLAPAGRRWWNVRTPERYIAAVATASRPRRRGRTSTTRPADVEGLQLALRTRDGVPASALDVDGLDGLVVGRRRAVRLTRRGRLLANEVSMRLR